MYSSAIPIAGLTSSGAAMAMSPLAAWRSRNDPEPYQANLADPVAREATESHDQFRALDKSYSRDNDGGYERFILWVDEDIEVVVFNFNPDGLTLADLSPDDLMWIINNGYNQNYLGADLKPVIPIEQ